MSDEHAEVGHWVGAYLLGALDPSERRRFERHQVLCARCQAELADLAPISSLLGRVDPAELAPPALIGTSTDAAEAAVGARAAAEYRGLVASSRRWRRVAAGSLAAAVALAALTTVDLVRHSRPDTISTTPAAVTATTAAPSGAGAAPSGPAVVAAEIVDSQVATANVTTSSRVWGTEVGLQVTGLPHRDGYQLWAVTHDGAWSGVASWGPTPSGSCRLTGATSLHPELVDYLVVTSGDQKDVLLKAEVRLA